MNKLVNKLMNNTGEMNQLDIKEGILAVVVEEAKEIETKIEILDESTMKDEKLKGIILANIAYALKNANTKRGISDLINQKMQKTTSGYEWSVILARDQLYGFVVYDIGLFVEAGGYKIFVFTKY